MIKINYRLCQRSSRGLPQFPFHTHTYMHIWRQRVHTPPKSYPVVEVSCCALSTLLPRFISPRDCDLRPRTPLPSRFSLPLNPEPTIFIAFHRSFSNLSILSIVQSILTTFVYLYKCYAEYLRDVNQIPFVELFCFLFFFCFFCLLPDCCFFHRVENSRSLGKLLEIFQEGINWNIVSGSFIKNLRFFDKFP